MTKQTVVVCYPHMSTVTEGFARKLAELCIYEPNNIAGIITASHPRQEHSRNIIIDKFLKGGREWLLWIDTDMTVPRDAAQRLVETALKHKADMVGALAFQLKRHEGIVVPNGYVFNNEIRHWQEIIDYRTDMVQEIDGVGGGFVLINRRVFEAWDNKFWHESWKEHPATGSAMGHDLAFAYRATQIDGFKLIWDTTVKVGHIKDFTVDAAAFRNYQRA